MDEWRVRLRAVVAGWGLSPEDQSDIADELSQHLEQQYAELKIRFGEAAARDRILMQVEDPALRTASIRPRHRPVPSVDAARRGGWGWDALMRDVRYGWRALFASPATTAMATFALALGIGLTTVMFGIVYGLLLRGLPFEEGDRIGLVMRSAAVNGEDEAVAIHEYFSYQNTQRSFETFGAFAPITVNLSGDERPERIEAARVTATLFDVSRVRPALGRVFRAEDEAPGGELTVMLSHSVWRDRYASDSSVVGRGVRVNGQPATVVGVMPDGFAFPSGTRLWLPLRVNPAATPWGTGPSVSVVGRLRPGATFASATAELIGLAQRLEAEHPQTNKGVRAIAQPFVRGYVRGQVFSLMYVMFGAVTLVFLVACTNVANLLLARATHRSKEVAVRAALGASRFSIARQFLVEAVVLALVSAALGALVAQIGLVAFRRSIADVPVPFFNDIRLYPQVFAFIALAALVASIVVGLLPALTAARSDITDVLKDQSLGSSGFRGGRLSRGLVVFELVLSSALLIVAALMTKTVMNLRAVEPGFQTRDILTSRVTLTVREPERQTAFFEQLEQAASQMPGAVSVTLTDNLPGTSWGRGRVAVSGRTYARPNDRPVVRQLAVSPGFFKTFGVAVSRGRAFGAEDRFGTLPVAIVNQRFVEENFRDVDPIGRQIKVGGDSTAPWLTVVGVIPNLYSATLDNPFPAEVLTAFHQARQSSASVAIRAGGDPTSLAQPLRKLVTSLDSDLPVYAVMPMARALDETMWPMRIFGGLFVVFGVVALALASIGLYAVLAFSVSRREREMGIRMALGAAASDVLRLVFRDGAIQLALGVAGGLALGVAGAQLGRAVFFQVRPQDPAMIAVVFAVLATTGFAACVGPALRATRADPVRSLRSE